MNDHAGRTPLQRELPWWLVPVQAAVIVACIVLVYGQSVRGPFFFDDYKAIVENEPLRQLWRCARRTRIHWQVGLW